MKKKNLTLNQKLELIKTNKDFDLFVFDEDWKVRKAVAERGRELDIKILIKDRNWKVRQVALKKLLEKIEDY